MPSFHHGPVEIAFLDAGEGEPIILIHGFASNKEVNWGNPGWVSTLTRAGRRAIALDNRGHGQSSKLYDPAQYYTNLMASDVVALMDHLKLPCADVMGYSMGARITAWLAHHHGSRVRAAILGGVGSNIVDGTGLPATIADALEAKDISEVASARGRQFRSFAEQTKSDLKALAACMRGTRQRLTREQAAEIHVPVLVAAGTKDDIAGSPEELAALIPGAKALPIPDRDHMLAVGDRVYKAGVLDFLATRP